MLLSARRHIGSILFLFLPSSWFKFKRYILSFMGIEIGENVKVNVGVRFFGNGPIKIGENSWVGPFCKFYTAGWGIEIGANCDIAPDVIFVCGSHELGSSKRRAGKGLSSPVIVGNGVWIGVRTTVLAVKIGNGAVVAGSALVNKDVPSNVLVAGVPAKTIKDLE